MKKDFVKVGDVSQNTIEKYRDKLPAAVVEIWEKYGYGTFYIEDLKVIDPDEFKDLLERTYHMGDASIPIFATAFGNLITWENGEILGIVQYRYGKNEVLSSGFNYFFEDL